MTDEAFTLAIRNTRSDYFWGRFWSSCVMRYGPFSGPLWLSVPMVGAFGIVNVGLSEYGLAPAPAEWLMLAAVYLFSCFFGAGLVALHCLIGASQIARVPGTLEIQRYDFTTKGIGVNWPQGANVVPWADWTRALETSAFVIVRHKRLDAELVFPKRETSNTDLVRLRDLLRTQLGQHARLRLPSPVRDL